ncbi:hypothetical protein GTP38_25175 [Duganella sp. FT94W]|uniref:Right handed beta helix domain-containing protein n=1 Tax=Duganella lactea TaxID=2692173 RepID=A0ABW9VJ48_9BURK|nr:hypothetical protein [Duganella lactea]MYM37622.1 hypothetical protein [Duganella lactea]
MLPIARRDFMKFLTMLSLPVKASEQPSVSSDSIEKNAPATTSACKKLPVVKLSEQLPKGFVVDGSVDYTQYIQKVLDQFSECGGEIELPANVSILVGNLVIHSNTRISGDKNTSILKIKPGCVGISANPEGARGMPKREVTNVVLSNFTIAGSVEKSGFSEHLHLLSMNGITNSKFSDLIISGFQGDGIYLGIVQQGSTVINTRKISISDVIIDGINRDNRNGISIVDGTEITIDKVTISRCSRRNMPGAIDIEPDIRQARIGDISISNVQIFDCGGGVGAVSLAYANVPFDTPPGKIRIDKVTVDGCASNAFAAISRRSLSAYHDPMNVDVVISNCIAKNGGEPFALVGVSNVKLLNNKFSDFKGTALVGYIRPEKKCAKILLSGNTWMNCGKISGTGLAIYSVSDLKIADEFIDCGAGIVGKANAISFNLGVSEFVDISRAKFSSPTGKTMVMIKKNIGHFFSPKTNHPSINKNTNLISEFEAR